VLLSFEPFQSNVTLTDAVEVSELPVSQPGLAVVTVQQFLPPTTPAAVRYLGQLCTCSETSVAFLKLFMHDLSVDATEVTKLAQPHCP